MVQYAGDVGPHSEEERLAQGDHAHRGRAPEVPEWRRTDAYVFRAIGDVTRRMQFVPQAIALPGQVHLLPWHVAPPQHFFFLPFFLCNPAATSSA